jgi:hypothetical protein
MMLMGQSMAFDHLRAARAPISFAIDAAIAVYLGHSRSEVPGLMYEPALKDSSA